MMHGRNNGKKLMAVSKVLVVDCWYLLSCTTGWDTRGHGEVHRPGGAAVRTGAIGGTVCLTVLTGLGACGSRAFAGAHREARL